MGQMLVSVDGVCWQIKVHTIPIRFSKIKNERNEMKMINGGGDYMLV